MDRQAWLAERQAAVVVYDAEAPTYDEHVYPLQGRKSGWPGRYAVPGTLRRVLADLGRCPRWPARLRGRGTGMIVAEEPKINLN
jgi:hypothetical protein